MYVAECFDKLFIVQVALMRYMQEEYATMVLGGQLGKEAKSLLKSVQRNTSVYTPEAIENVKTVLAYTAAANQQQQQQQQVGRGGHFRSRAPFF